MHKMTLIALGAALLRGQAYTISTFAGGEPPLSGVAGTASVVYLPEEVATDGAGNVYIAETPRHRVRKLGADGTISVLAGTGIPGFSGDGGPASAAQLTFPVGLSVDRNGAVYIADLSNHRIRRVAADGTISTVAGTGFGFAGDGGRALEARLNSPRKVLVDGDGNIYVSDLGNQRIRKIDRNGIISTIAGTGTAGYSGDGGPATEARINNPYGLALDPQGRLHFADLGNHRVRRIASDGTISTVVGTGIGSNSGDGGPALSAGIINPRGIAIDGDGVLYVAHNAWIRKVTNGQISRLAGVDINGGFSGDGGRAVEAQLSTQFGIAVARDGSVYMADRSNFRVRRITQAGMISTVAGGGHQVPDGSPASTTPLLRPAGMAIDRSGNLFVAEIERNTVSRISPSGALTRAAGTGRTAGVFTLGATAGATDLNVPVDVSVDAAGNLFVATQLWHRVLRVSTGGNVSVFAGTGAAESGGDGGPAAQGLLNQPQGVTLDGAGNLYIADTENDQIRKVSASGTIERLAGQNQSGFRGDNGPANASLLNRPMGLAVDSTGSVYFADTSNMRVRKITAAGVISTVAGNGGTIFEAQGVPAASIGIGLTTGVALDATGNLYLVASNRVYRVTPDGSMTRIAGTGAVGFSGDGGLATLARFNNPTRIAVAPDGRIFVADTGNHTIRVMTPITAASLAITRGDNQTGPVNGLLPVPLTVRAVSSAGIGVPGVVVGFAIASGAGRLSSASATTGDDGTASVTLTLGATAGTVTVTASAPGLPAVTLTQTATAAGGTAGPTPPSIAPGGLRSAGLMYAAGRVSPSAIVSIFGSDFAPAGTFRQAGAADLDGAVVPRILDGVCVLFGTTRAALFVLTPAQINLQVPPVSGSVGVRVVKNCGTPSEVTSNTLTVTAQPATPEFFSFALNGDGRNPVAAVNAVSGAMVGRGGSFVPAKPGDYLTIYATGFGATDPVVPYGELAAAAARVTATVRVRVGTVDLDAADILYAGVAPFNAGLHQLSIRLPESTPAGDLPIVVTIGGAPSPAGSFVAVEP
ncbi:MAG: hypothetical protein FJW30_08870 [Acidobacteria bacterium]|nr:hypothetical protein [Acidobacteriota bacterium]